MKFWPATEREMQLPFASMEVLGETSHLLSEILGHRAWVNLDWGFPTRLLPGCEISGEVVRCRPTSFLQRGRHLLLIIFILIVAVISLCARAFHVILCVVQDAGVCFSFPGCCEFHCIDLQGTANSSCRVWSLLTVEDSYSQLSKLHLYQLWAALVAFLKPCFHLRFR